MAGKFNRYFTKLISSEITYYLNISELSRGCFLKYNDDCVLNKIMWRI